MENHEDIQEREKPLSDRKDGEKISEALSIAKSAAKAAYEARGEDILILDVRKIIGYTEYMVIASCPSETRLTGIAKQVDKALGKEGVRVLGRDGVGTGWMIYDAGEVFIHIFTVPMREFYQLELLWGDAPRVAFNVN